MPKKCQNLKNPKNIYKNEENPKNYKRRNDKKIKKIIEKLPKKSYFVVQYSSPPSLTLDSDTIPQLTSISGTIA